MLRQSLTQDAMKQLKKKGVIKGLVEIPGQGDDKDHTTWSKPVENNGEGEGEDFVMWPRAEENTHTGDGAAAEEGIINKDAKQGP